MCIICAIMDSEQVFDILMGSVMHFLERCLQVYFFCPTMNWTHDISTSLVHTNG